MSLFSYLRPCGLIKELIAMKINSLALVLSAVLMFTAIALGTTAYITDTTGALNRFTVGDVSIHVDETAVDPSGKPIPGAARVEENDYHLVPGRSYVKDPTLTIDAGSESAYIRMLVTLTVPGAITGEQLESIAEFDIQVLGQAIQAGVFPSADEAWSAFEDQVNP